MSRMQGQRVLILGVLAITFGMPSARAADPPRRPVGARHAMVVTAQRLATEVGVDVLRRGGNAVDAAVAVGYALAVVFPVAGNLGGGGFMTIRMADGRETVIDFRETAPRAASHDMYLDSAGRVIPGSSTHGVLAVGVPGTVAGLELARSRYGTMSRAALLTPAIGYARDGFVLRSGDARFLRRSAGGLAGDPAAAAIFLPHGRAIAAGQRLVQRDLAKTLERIRDRGAAGFYRGPVAARIAAAMIAPDGRRRGLVTEADLDHYRARERAPVECTYRGYRVLSAPPPSSGGVVLCEMLNILGGLPLQTWGAGSVRAAYVEIEAMRRAYRDRNRDLGDPDFVRNPVARLLAPAYAARLRAGIVAGMTAKRAGIPGDDAPGAVGREGAQTTHYAIVDRAGNAVSVTVTLNGPFGAQVVAPGTGVLLNDEMDDFAIKPGTPNQYGLVQGEANSIAPGKRPLSSMTPTIITKQGKPILVVGTPGGSRIITGVLETILGVVDYGLDIQQAVDAPRFHQQWRPRATMCEPGALPRDTQRTLEAWGERFTTVAPYDHVDAILVGGPALGRAAKGGERLFGADDSRGDTGLAAGY